MSKVTFYANVVYRNGDGEESDLPAPTIFSTSKYSDLFLSNDICKLQQLAVLALKAIHYTEIHKNLIHILEEEGNELGSEEYDELVLETVTVRDELSSPYDFTYNGTNYYLPLNIIQVATPLTVIDSDIIPSELIIDIDKV